MRYLLNIPSFRSSYPRESRWRWCCANNPDRARMKVLWNWNHQRSCERRWFQRGRYMRRKRHRNRIDLSLAQDQRIRLQTSQHFVSLVGCDLWLSRFVPFHRRNRRLVGALPTLHYPPCPRWSCVWRIIYLSRFWHSLRQLSHWFCRFLLKSAQSSLHVFCRNSLSCNFCCVKPHSEHTRPVRF